MSDALPLAPLDPIPLPAPVWLLHGLLILTFLLHVLPMSVTLGGGFWAIFALRRADEDPAYAALAVRLGRWLPYWTAGTITTGVAALLFLQVLYGHVFYSAAIAMAWPWLAVVGLVLLAYYATYLRAHRVERSPRSGFVFGVVAWLAFVLVAFIYTNQMTLMLHPERVAALHFADPTGFNLNLGEPSLWPRALHMLSGATALAALWVAALGLLDLKRGNEKNGRTAVRLGVNGFFVVTLVSMSSGLWFLFSLPRDQWMLVMGRDLIATVAFGLAWLATGAGLIILWRAKRDQKPRRKIIVGALHVGLVVAMMLLIRDSLRRDTLGDAAGLSAMVAQPQWGAMGLFLGCLVVGLGALVWMLRVVVRGRGG